MCSQIDVHQLRAGVCFKVLLVPGKTQEPLAGDLHSASLVTAIQFLFQTCPAAGGLGEETLVLEADAAQLHI